MIKKKKKTVTSTSFSVRLGMFKEAETQLTASLKLLDLPETYAYSARVRLEISYLQFVQDILLMYFKSLRFY